MNGPLAERTDVVLAELAGFLDALESRPGLDFDYSKIILITATDASTTLPCCKQSLGYRNQQVSKLWAATHWNNDTCKAYWKDIHVICVRKLRKNSAYAKEDEVQQVLAKNHTWSNQRFLHNLKAVVAPPAGTEKVLAARQPLAARSPSAATPLGAIRTASQTTSKSKAISDSPSSVNDSISPINPKLRTAASKGRLSEPLLNTASSARSPIVTRRTSGILKPSSVDPKPLDRRTSALRPISAISPVTRPVHRKASEQSLSSIRPRLVAARAVSAGSAIPTPTRRTSVNLLAGVRDASPGSPSDGPRRTSFAKPNITVTRRVSPTVRRKASGGNCNSPLINKQGGDSESPSMGMMTNQIERLKREIGTAVAYSKDLEMENERLKKQKLALLEETAHSMEGESKALHELKAAKESLIRTTISAQADTKEQFAKQNLHNEQLLHQMATAVDTYKDLDRMYWELCKAYDMAKTGSAELIERNAALTEEKGKLDEKLQESKETCRVLVEKWAEAEEKIAGLEAKLAASVSVGADLLSGRSSSENNDATPAEEVTLTPPTTPPVTPLRIAGSAVTSPASSAHAVLPPRPAIAFLTPVRTPRIGEPRKIRTPLSTSVKRSNKKNIGIWKRLARSRLFGI